MDVQNDFLCSIFLTASLTVRFTVCRSTHAMRDSSDGNSSLRPRKKVPIILESNFLSLLATMIDIKSETVEVNWSSSNFKSLFSPVLRKRYV